MQTVIMQVVIQEATVGVRAIRAAEPPGELHIRRSIKEEHYRSRQTRPMLTRLSLTGRHQIGMWNC